MTPLPRNVSTYTLMLALLALPLVAASCGSGDEQDSGAGGSAAGTGGSGVAGAGGSAAGTGGSGVAGTGGSGVAGTGGASGTGGSAGAPCTGPGQCSAPTPVCDTSTGKCVECLPDKDSCPVGSYCDSSHTCSTGCAKDTDCDNGGGTPLVCNLATHKCVGCLNDSTCQPGTICDQNSCIAGCTPQHACATGSQCCEGKCFDGNSDPLHCGSCNPCPAPVSAHAPAVCNNAVCGFGPCESGFGDCNNDPVDGCEADLKGEPACACAPGSQADCYDGPPGTLGHGPCVKGKKTCNADGVGYGPCEGQVLPQQETCGNDVDDDCNGKVNDSGSDCACVPDSTQSCYSGPPGTADVGQCKAGTQTCNALGQAWGACNGEIVPSPEDCSKPGDENCNGEVNELSAGCVCAPGSTQHCYGGPAGTENQGPCVGGTQTCNDNGQGWGTCVGQVVPQTETCFNDVDDDCNGQINESGPGCVCTPNASAPCYDGPPDTLGVGTCIGGTRTCNALGTAWGACEGQIVPQPESCLTAEDDNCNGQVNEGGVGCVCAPNSTSSCYSGPAGTENVGLCVGGTKTCNALGTQWGDCQGEVTPQPETCITPWDENCNGQFNEGGSGCVCTPNATQSCYTGPAGTLGKGACKAGTQTCDQSGLSWGACQGEVTPQLDSCATTADEDCSGSNNTCLPSQDCNAQTGVCQNPCDPLVLGKSYVGCEYYPTVTSNEVGSQYHFAVAISNTQSVAVNYTITRGNTSIASGQVSANNVAVVQLPWISELKDPTATIRSTNAAGNGAYHLVADRPVTVYQYSPIEFTLTGTDTAASNDASLLLPVNAWTGNYMVAARNTWSSYPGFYAVTASEDGTVVTLGPSATGGIVIAGAGVAANGIGTISLNKGDVLQVLSGTGGGAPDAADVTGTLITSTKPVQVIGGHTCTDVPYNITYCDHLEESIFPIETLSKTYIVTTPWAALNTLKNRIVRVVATAANTTLTYDPPQAGFPTTITAAGRYVEMPPSQANYKITANNKILVAQYMEGQNAGSTGTGDPAMALAVAVEQYRSKYLFHAPTNYTYNFVDIVAPTGATVTLDGVAVAASTFQAIGTTGYGLARVQLSNAGNGNHSISSSMPVGIDVYGYGQVTSYWYPGGLDLKALQM